MEIEKKFIVDTKWLEQIRQESSHTLDITQGYLSTDPEKTVRIRIQNSSAFLTIKGISKMIDGFDARDEIEISITLDDADRMMKLCDKIIYKTRFLVPFCGFTFEVDVFKGKNYGLVLAEVEIDEIDKANDIELPEWIGEDVTGHPDYYNSVLAK
jgi:adenylate cyclase